MSSISNKAKVNFSLILLKIKNIFRKLKYFLAWLFRFDAEKSFFECGPVWFCIFIVFAIAASIGYLMYDPEKYAYHWVYKVELINELVSDFRLPISFLGLLIPLGAILAVHHKSIQSKHHSRQLQSQLDQSKRDFEYRVGQENFFMVFRHKDEFVKYLKADSTFNEYDKKNVDFNHLHLIFYPNIDRGDYSASEAVTSKFIDDSIAMHSFLNDIALDFTDIEGLRAFANRLAIGLSQLDTSPIHFTPIFELRQWASRKKFDYYQEFIEPLKNGAVRDTLIRIFENLCFFSMKYLLIKSCLNFINGKSEDVVGEAHSLSYQLRHAFPISLAKRISEMAETLEK